MQTVVKAELFIDSSADCLTVTMAKKAMKKPAASKKTIKTMKKTKPKKAMKKAAVQAPRRMRMSQREAAAMMADRLIQLGVDPRQVAPGRSILEIRSDL